jgi:hypothetical protein
LKIREEFRVFQCTAKVPLIEFLCLTHRDNMLVHVRLGLLPIM